MPPASDRYDLTRLGGRLAAYWHFLWRDHAVLRLAFRNTSWVSDELARSNQPWPHQLAAWKRRGLRTVICLRGGYDGSHYALEREACERLGLELVIFRVGSREAPRADQVAALAALFETVAYPALIHCKSGSDRTGLVGALYLHLRRGASMGVALRQLGLRHGHLPHGETGILDYVLQRYRAEAEPTGVSFLEWTQSAAYDPAALEAAYRARGPGRWLEKLLRRE